MNLNLIKYLLGFSLLLTTSCDAVTVDRLFEATVPVASRRDTDRGVAFQQALTQVFVKVAANEACLEARAIKQAIQTSEPLVQQFDYIVAEDGKLQLRVEFNQSQVTSALSKASFSPWGKQRPLTLLWLAQEQGDNKEFISLETNNQFLVHLLKNAQTRGLPLILPLYDLEDASAINARDLWEKPINFVQQASERYQSDSVLVGKIIGNLTNNSWQVDWHLLVANDIISWKSEGDDPELLMAQALSRSAKELQGHFKEAVKSKGFWSKKSSSDLMIRVTNIRSVNDYAALTRYLSELEPVDKIQVLQMKPNEMIMKLQLKNTVSALKSTLEMEKHLQVATAPLGSSDTMLHYQWSS